MMDPATVRQELKKVPLFWSLGDADLDRFAAAMEERTYGANDLVFEQGDEGDAWYLIGEGDFEVFLRQHTVGFEKSLTLLGPGGHFGEIALFLSSPRSASVRALHRDAFNRIIDDAPRCAIGLGRGLAEYLVRAEAHAYSMVPFVDLDDVELDPEVCALLPPRSSLVCRAIVLARRGDRVTVAMVDPYVESTRDFIRATLAGFRLEFVAISDHDFDRYEKQHLGSVGAIPLNRPEIGEFVYITPSGPDAARRDQPGSRLVHEMLTHALRYGASDLHFEAGRHTGQVRSRIDGKLAAVEADVPLEILRQAVSRLKVLSELDITERRRPQDGSFRLRVGEREVDLRVAPTPCYGGEKAVVRVLDPVQQRTNLNRLVVWEAAAMQVTNLFLQPSGLLLVTGPTGAGKTTTLYAGLAAIWASSKTCNIVTIEDPIEYRLPYATQIQVDRAVDLGFARILRATLRQDPNIILVGEIRDRESGAIALEAAGTGHLVLSLLHTHFALDAITRLRNLNIQSYLIGSSLKGIVSQRLVDQVCPDCAKPLPPGSGVETRLRALGILPDRWHGELLQGSGCERCRFTGELGRVAMYEVLIVDDALRDAIEQNAAWTELKAVLTPDCYVPMALYARHLIEHAAAAPDSVARTFPRQLVTEA